MDNLSNVIGKMGESIVTQHLLKLKQLSTELAKLDLEICANAGSITYKTPKVKIGMTKAEWLKIRVQVIGATTGVVQNDWLAKKLLERERVISQITFEINTFVSP